jgi:hypothetical protein
MIQPKTPFASDAHSISCIAGAGRDDATLARCLRAVFCGVSPVSALKARLNGPSEPKPASSAIVEIGVADCAGSASAALASARRH